MRNLDLSVKTKPEQVSVFFMGDVPRDHGLACNKCQRSFSGPVASTHLVKWFLSGLLSIRNVQKGCRWFNMSSLSTSCKMCLRENAIENVIDNR